MMHEYESWIIKKAEHRRIHAFELWFWRRLLRVPWQQGDQTNQSFFFPSVYLFIYLFYITILYCFCDTLTWICIGCTCVLHPEPLFHLPPHPIPLGHPSAPALSVLYRALNPDWRLVSHMIITCFNAILPYHPSLALSHRVQKTVLYICVSFAVSHTGLSLPSF